MYNAYITKVKNVRPHSNADRLDLGDCFGNTVCFTKGQFVEGELVVYFPVDGQLSEEFCQVHDLVRRKDDAGNPCGGYLEPDKRNIKAIRLRGEKSDGLAMPLSCLEYTGVDIRTLEAGFCFTVINGHSICQKYIPRSNRCAAAGSGNRTRKHKTPVAPLFAEHADTEQLAYNLGAFRPGDEIEITLKMHGTSGRTAHLPVLKGYRRTLLDRLFRREGTPIYEYDYVSGTRRVVLEDYEGGFYGDNAFREQHSKVFEGKLHQGETAYYEIVGFTNSGAPIMSQAANKKMNDKDFIKQYGETTTFSYGCSPTGEGEPIDYWDDEKTQPCTIPILPISDMYVYRMTYTSPEGYVIEYTPDMMRRRCEEMGVKTVPVFYKGFIETDTTKEKPIYYLIGQNSLDIYSKESAGSAVQTMAECFYDGPDPIGKTHVREGVVVRIINRPKFTAYKHKNFAFKVLEGICKNDATEPDMEEMQEEFKETR